MKIERINENSIICTLTSFDLSVRNLNLRELAYGSDKARKLFEEMMNKASAEVGFNAEGTPIMIEAVPMGSDSIKLIISKVTDPEELDARFSRFTRSSISRKDAENWLNTLASALLEGAGDLAGHAGSPEQETVQAPDAAGQKQEENPSGSEKPEGKEPAPSAVRPEFRAFAFDDLDMVIRASRAAYSYDGESTLYKSPSESKYVLVIKSPAGQDDRFARCCNSIAEYGRMVRIVQNTLSYYDEHYKIIIAEGAISKLALI